MRDITLYKYLKEYLWLLKMSRGEVWKLELVRQVPTTDGSVQYDTGGSYGYYALRERVERYQHSILNLEGTRWQPKDHVWGPEGVWAQQKRRERLNYTPAI